MESLIITLVYAVVAAIAYGMRDRSVDGTTVSLCLTCVNAMITRGTGGEERIACTCGGVLRPVTLTVFSYDEMSAKFFIPLGGPKAHGHSGWQTR